MMTLVMIYSSTRFFKMFRENDNFFIYSVILLFKEINKYPKLDSEQLIQLKNLFPT